MQNNHVGIINVSLRLKDIVEKWAEFVRRLAAHHYGKAPEIRLSGHVASTFPYIALPLGIQPILSDNLVRTFHAGSHLFRLNFFPFQIISCQSCSRMPCALQSNLTRMRRSRPCQPFT